MSNDNTMMSAMNPGAAMPLYDGKNDAQLSKPYVDVDEWRTEPVKHRYIHGGFEGTESRFCIYMPPAEAYKGRFFQQLMPVQGPETAGQGQTGEEDFISFCITHGAMYVMTNLGGIVNGGGDGTIAYRCSAQAAIYARKLADEMYGERHHYGYIFGGSGGGFKTISAAENTTGIWDGAVPHVIGSPMAMPNVFTVRAHAMRVLRNKFPEIVDAIEPGGSGDPYACLNEEQAAALKESILMGFPMDTWCEYETIGQGALPVLYPAIPMMDPTYFTDFWTKEGYLGADPNGSAARDRIHYETTVDAVRHPEMGLTGIAESIDEGNAYGVDEAWKHQIGKAGRMPVLVLGSFPDVTTDPYTEGLTIRFLSGALEGQKINAAWLGYTLVTGIPDASGRNIGELLKKVQAGDRVEVDNSDYIAVQTYHRHQVPGPEFTAWDQFRDAQGNPVYPQRPMLVGPILALGGAGSVQNGKPNIPMFILESHMDESAFPWQADWYRNEVIRQKGNEDSIRLYVMEHCMHTDCEEGNGGDHQHIVSYLGARNQLLLSLSDWVERGIEPAQNTGYCMDGGQMILADTAAGRKGFQPLVCLTINGKDRADIKENETVTFEAVITLPEDCGSLEEVHWSFEGTDEFLPEGSIGEENTLDDGTRIVTAQASHTFTTAGTWFPVVKVACNAAPGDLYTRIRNQARVRVVVK